MWICSNTRAPISPTMGQVLISHWVSLRFTPFSFPCRKVMATWKDRVKDYNLAEESDGDTARVPCPGDTLPWNLPKHQRIKRSKSASGEVLDPAERAVIRIAGRGRFWEFWRVPSDCSAHGGRRLAWFRLWKLNLCDLACCHSMTQWQFADLVDKQVK